MRQPHLHMHLGKKLEILTAQKLLCSLMIASTSFCEKKSTFLVMILIGIYVTADKKLKEIKHRNVTLPGNNRSSASASCDNGSGNAKFAALE